MQTIEQLQQELARLKRELAALRRSKQVHSSDYRDYIPVHGGRVHKSIAEQFDITIRPEVLRYKIEYLEHDGGPMESYYDGTQDYLCRAS